ncbi:MAG TPA: ribonuclease HII [Fimbriimonadales bacterium]|nr:ribonuclease HII [Fimbriimonadales bacterium]
MALARKANWVGIDEVGRGPLAGPVVAAAVLIPEGVRLRGVRDSKIVPKNEREELAELIKEKCFYAYGVASVEEIDKLNILRASLLAMQRAFLELLEKYDWIKEDVRISFREDKDISLISERGVEFNMGEEKLRNVQGVLIDGKYVFSLPEDMNVACKAVVDGDAKILPIAAASIVAKTYRDEIMKELSFEHAVYGFEKNFGYATRQHLEALENYGPCSAHRQSFMRVREVIYQKCLKFEN